MLLIVNSTEKDSEVEDLINSRIIMCSFLDINNFKVDIQVHSNNPSKIISTTLLGKDFAGMRNYAIAEFLRSKDRHFIYINAHTKTQSFRSLIESIPNNTDGFLFNQKEEIVGFILLKETIEALGGHHFLSQLLIKKNNSEDENPCLQISNEALDFDYLYRYIKYKELLAITYKEELKLSEEELKYKEKFDKDPVFFRNKVSGNKISEYYMLYMNSMSAFLNKTKQSGGIVKEYSKVFKRIKRDVLSTRTKKAQESFILGFLYYHPIYDVKEAL